MPEYEKGEAKAWPSRCRFGPNLVPRGKMAQKRTAQGSYLEHFLASRRRHSEEWKALFPGHSTASLEGGFSSSLYQSTYKLRMLYLSQAKLETVLASWDQAGLLTIK